MSFLQQLLIFLISLGFIILLHELGHYVAARFFGVKVKEFSIGFGPSLSKYVTRSGETFNLRGVPLGGFVRMLHSSDEDYNPDQADVALDKQPVWQRLIIVLAGPFVNFLLAIILFFAVLLVGVDDFKSIIDQPPSDTVAFEKGLVQGDKILSVNGKSVVGWSDFSLALVDAASSSGQISLVAERERHSEFTVNFTAPASLFKNSTQPVSDMGFFQFVPILPIIGGVANDSPAQRAGVRVGEQILSVNGVKTPYWGGAVRMLRSLPNQTVNIELYSKNKNLTRQVSVLLAAKRLNDKPYGFLGVEPTQQKTALDEVTVKVKYPLGEALVNAFDKTWQSSIVTLNIIRKLVTGRATVKHLSGPLSIAKSTAQSFDAGTVYWLSILAAISVSLGVLNLLPIPVLDGGHALFYIVEWVKGSPVSEKLVLLSQQLGFLLLGAVMLLAFANDLALFK